ncbi:hypothetical protein HU200_045177 [Digitaria exilis]|uniref:Uncharacterized protein n=1 Tax=Digitaria exilis TaxID=1010633 RepID=A0A835B5Z1_9POAL|nr:hypothetical protein HU200_045177 [Digitaria exilis]
MTASAVNGNSAYGFRGQARRAVRLRRDGALALTKVYRDARRRRHAERRLRWAAPPHGAGGAPRVGVRLQLFSFLSAGGMSVMAKWA